jgi:hypothetical protein
VRQQVEDCLERLRADLGGWLALLTHDSGTLVAWTGPGDPAAMAHYCQARTVRVVSHSALPSVVEPAEIDRLVSTSIGRPADLPARHRRHPRPAP